VIDQSTIEEIKHRLNIIDVINRHVPIKKQGKNYSACCPFHDEKNPSFTVNENKQFFYCFGCGASGDLVEFYQRYNGLSFTETIAQLSVMAGVTVNKTGLVMMPKKVKDMLEDDRMIILMANEYEKTGVRLSYQDKQRKRLAQSRYESLAKQYNIQ